MQPDRLSLATVSRLLGATLGEIEELIELAYLPEPSRGGSVSLAAFLALLGRSLVNVRLQRLHISERVVWMYVLGRQPEVLRAVVRHRFSPGSLGKIVQAKLLGGQSPDHAWIEELDANQGSGKPRGGPG